MDQHKDIKIFLKKIIKDLNDLKAIDIRGISYLSDFFIICHGESEPHVKAITDNINANKVHISRVLDVLLSTPLIAVSKSNSGQVRIYDNSNGTWTQIGSDIDGEDFDDHSGNSVSLSGDGTVVAIGAYGNDGNGSDSGHVRVYENNNGTWTQIGSDIDGEAAKDK